MLLPTVLLALSLCGAPDKATNPDQKLKRGIALFNDLDDERAVALFHALLAQTPPVSRDVNAKAHLYLGLIAFNALRVDDAAAEFKAALRGNPALDPPRGASPKVRLAFDQARREVDREATAQAAEPIAPAPTPPLVASTAPTPPLVLSPEPSPLAEAEEPLPKRSSSHALAWTLGAVGVLSGAVAVYGGVQVANYNGLVSNANGHGGTVDVSQIRSSQGAAQVWSVAWIVLAAVGVAGVTGAVLTW